MFGARNQLLARALRAVRAAQPLPFFVDAASYGVQAYPKLWRCALLPLSRQFLR